MSKKLKVTEEKFTATINGKEVTGDKGFFKMIFGEEKVKQDNKKATTRQPVQINPKDLDADIAFFKQFKFTKTMSAERKEEILVARTRDILKKEGEISSHKFKIMFPKTYRKLTYFFEGKTWDEIIRFVLSKETQTEEANEILHADNTESGEAPLPHPETGKKKEDEDDQNPDNEESEAEEEPPGTITDKTVKKKTGRKPRYQDKETTETAILDLLKTNPGMTLGEFSHIDRPLYDAAGKFGLRDKFSRKKQIPREYTEKEEDLKWLRRLPDKSGSEAKKADTQRYHRLMNHFKQRWDDVLMSIGEDPNKHRKHKKHGEVINLTDQFVDKKVAEEAIPETPPTEEKEDNSTAPEVTKKIKRIRAALIDNLITKFRGQTVSEDTIIKAATSLSAHRPLLEIFADKKEIFKRLSASSVNITPSASSGESFARPKATQTEANAAYWEICTPCADRMDDEMYIKTNHKDFYEIVISYYGSWPNALNAPGH